MALALYRKYRPATFAEVVGQEHVTQPLRTALAAGRVNHAYLFSGPRGCGKTSSARILARSLNCVHGPTPDPCGECPSCIALAPEGPGSLDVVELDAASHGGVDDTRDLRDRAFYMPAESRYRVFIIDEAHMVTTQGFNALLKIVEEPPEHLVFIFATTEPDKVLTTIRSRTHHYPFRLIAPSVLRTMLERLCEQEGAVVEPAVLPLVIRAGGGSARDTLSMLDQLLAGAGPEGVTYRSAVALLGVTDAALLDEVVDALAAGDGGSVFAAVDRVIEAGHDPRRFATDLLQRLRDLVILSAVPDAGAKGLIDAPSDQLESMSAQADRLGAATATRMAEVLHTGLVDMRGTTSPRLVLELLCARMLLPATADGDGALLQRLERMERRMEIAADEPEPTARPVRQPTAVEIPLAEPAGPEPAAEPEQRTGTAERAAERTAAGRPAQGPNAQQRPAASRPAAPARPQRPEATPAGPDLGLPAPPTLRSTARAARPDASRPEQPRPDQARPDQARTTPPDSRRTPPDQARPAARAPEPDRNRPAAGSPAGGQPPGSDRVARPAPAAASSAPTRSAESAPAAHESSPTPASEIEVVDVRRNWPEVLAKVQQRRRTTQILLESATVVALENGVLRLTMPSAALARRVLEPANADLLRAGLKQVLGVDWRIQCDADGPAARPAAAERRPAAAADPWDGAPLPEPPADGPDEEIPDDYGDPAPPTSGSQAPRDPEAMALELLTTQLGARPLEP
ncbi:DNA polymerase III subunit gamma and tau [Nakamurella multipartita]|uniref:DNA polymerase III subunit gamma/tau n=1 Tax=Nakamurella multipartita (strain ATCC 700099 / DSM 44233 / CIP 104796 / JCM 9543 / NBRC 105858 / Y-104) TaxID=479431 RepID=C8X888_NAKMY|nr:DNA polymerase III subunit gamma and tau [Nakamurella multipartita]ACV77064.1 DNA polymerase III, subunits gamma and tau [Nakamurella multipartita DSM 44233]HOZ57038.1 DNA polymerase III subunit gamma and tau [Nakamurella multipartita]